MVARHTNPASGASLALLEVLVATAVTLLLAAVLFALVARSAENVRAARSSVDEFQQAQRAFETLSQRVGQATLNNYRDAVVTNGQVQPYQRMSELRFACGPMQCGVNPLDTTDGGPPRVRPGHGVFFQATTGRPATVGDPAFAGLGSLLNAWGYFVEAGSDNMPPPSFLPQQIAAQRVAPRLMELREPTERLSIYHYTSGQPDYAGFDWFRLPLADRTLVHTVAENIAVLLVVPKLTAQEAERLAPTGTPGDRDALLAPQLFYHSGTPTPPGTDAAHNMRHRLPASVELTMVALDAATVARLYQPGALDPLKLSDAFHDALQLHAELQIDPAQPQYDSLERRLIAAHAHYRLFTTVVPIRAAQ